MAGITRGEWILAIMVPSLTSEQIEAQHGSNSEASVYAALRDRLAVDVTVLYSVPWIDVVQNQKRDGEIDFIVIDPSNGILILEAKGGTVEISSGGRWFTRDSNGNLLGITNPFRQGVDSKNVVKRQIAGIPGIDASDLQIGHGVILSDMFGNPGNLGVDAPSDIVITGDEIETIDQRILEIFNYWSSEKPTAIDSECIQRIVEHIFPHRVLTPPLGVDVRSAEERIVELTQQQCRYLGFLRNQRRVCIEGAAGTGKTVLAFEKAKQLAEDGVPTLLTCYNTQLATRLSKAAHEVPNMSVRTFHDTCLQMAQEAKFTLPENSEDFTSEFFDVKLPDMLLKALDVLPERRFGAVIVDEAQDLDPEWWALLELLLKDDKESFFWAFRDSNQNLYDRQLSMPAEMQVFALEENVRNSQAIHDAAAPFASGNPGKCMGPEGGEVRYEFATNKSAIRSVLSRTLHNLVKGEGLKEEEVIVLTTSSVANSALADVDRVGAFELRQFGDEGRGVSVESIWRFKGLDRPAVIIVGISKETDDALKYVAMTRARRVLVLIGEKSALEIP